MCVAAKHAAETVRRLFKFKYCSGDCMTKKAQLHINQEFVAALNSSSAYSTHCQTFPGCGVTNISVECSQRNTRSMKRNCTHNFQITFGLYINLRVDAVVDATKLWAEIQDTFKKMMESVRQLIERSQFHMAVTHLPKRVKPDSFEEVNVKPHLQCPPGSLPRYETLTCSMLFTTQQSHNSLFDLFVAQYFLD